MVLSTSVTSYSTHLKFHIYQSKVHVYLTMLIVCPPKIPYKVNIKHYTGHIYQRNVLINRLISVSTRLRSSTILSSKSISLRYLSASLRSLSTWQHPLSVSLISIFTRLSTVLVYQPKSISIRRWWSVVSCSQCISTCTGTDYVPLTGRYGLQTGRYGSYSKLHW
jgi:hypothetical protein